MKKFFLFMAIILCISNQAVFSQNCNGYPVKMTIDSSVLIFEGKILTDSSFQNKVGVIYGYHYVLVLKQFKGIFESDTLKVITYGGTMSINGMLQGDYPAYAHKNDEAVFLVSKWSNKPIESDLYYVSDGDVCGFKKVCNKKDVVKEVYEPIEQVTGQPYVDVHPNNCATQQKK